LITSLTVGGYFFAVDGFCEDPGAGCFTHPSWSAEKKCMCEVFLPDGIAQSSGDMGLSHDRVKGLWAILSGGNNEFIH
jgi:hypothetical protein